MIEINIYELIGLLAGSFAIISIYLVGIKQKVGFIFGIFANILWVYTCLITNSQYGLLLVSLVATILNIKGFIKWRKDEKKQ